MGLLTITAISPLLALWLPNFTLAKPWLAIVESLVSAVLIFWAFTLPIFWQMMRTKPHHLFRQTESSRRQQGLAWLVSGLLLVLVMLLLLPSGVRVPVILGFAVVTLVLLGVAGILQTLVFRLQSTSRGWLRLVIANLKYDRMSLMVQFVAFGLVLYLLLVLTFVQGNLVNHWQASLGADTPNVFVINIQPDEQAQVAQVLTAQGIEAEMIPMLRARLVAHNGKPLSVDQFTSARAKRLLDREANVAVMTDLPEHNRIFAQITEAERQTAYPAMSVERGIAELFGLKLTDQIAFEVQGMKVAFQITAIREVAWQSLQPNFFFIAQPWTQEALPVTYLTSFHHPQTTQTTTAPENTASLASLKSALQAIAPSLLWFDVQSLIVQLQQLMQQAGTAVSFLYVFALLASVLVIFSATLAAQEGRYRQWLVLRTLGAQTGQLVLIGLFEYVLIGLLAGTLSAFLAQATQMLIALYWLNLSPQWDMKLWFIGWGIGVASLVILAYLAQAPLRKLGAKQLQSRAS